MVFKSIIGFIENSNKKYDEILNELNHSLCFENY